MSRDFEQIGHKNLELLRFYVSKDIRKIDAKIQNNESDLLGYFLGSLVDVLVVLLFDDFFATFLEAYVTDINWQVMIKIVLIIALVGLFLLVSWSSKKIREHRIKRMQISGKRAYIVSAERQEMIDDFDNIACDGLLICQNYVVRYKQAEEQYIKDFYLYEIIHHLNKAASIGNVIYNNQKLYVSAMNTQLLDSYRINNFISFSQNIVRFLSDEIPEKSGNRELDNDMINLKELIGGWKMID